MYLLVFKEKFYFHLFRSRIIGALLRKYKDDKCPLLYLAILGLARMNGF
jgi:hypothetical protein